MISILFLLAVANNTSFHFFLRLTSAFTKSAVKSRFMNHSKSNNQMWNVSHHKIIGAWGLAYWSWLIFETKETKGYSNTTASYSLPRYFWRQKTEVKAEYSKRSDEVLPRSNWRYKLRFHHGSIAENAPIQCTFERYCVHIPSCMYM